MFGRDQNKLVQSLLEKSGAVCGSIQNTIQDEDNIKWVKSKAEGVRLKGVECAHTAYQNLNSEEERKDASGILEASHDMSQTIRSDESTEATYSTDGASKRDNNKLRGATSASSRGRAVGSVPSVSSSVSVPQTVVIGLCLSRKSGIGHAGTVTRQTEYDFNELQDRDYKYVSSTDERGWLAGGGERRDPHVKPSELEIGEGDSHKVAAPDTVHIPIIEINTDSAAAVNEIVAALARGEIFIPHMSILPESLTVKGKSPPDLVVSFGCEKNDDANPEDWSNWCLEFLHNQLYEYFAPLGAQWSKRPFQITLARNVKWKTIKHMNKYFARSENVINSWREKGAQYLTPQKDAVGVTNEEITNPHGIYLLRNGKATNYFPPNFEPPYTTNVTRSLIRNVVNKSWDAKHRDWLVEPLPLYRGPIQIISSILGCASAPGCATIKAIDMSALDVSCADDMTLVADLTHDGKVGRKQKKGKTPLKEMKPNHGEVKQNHSAGHEEKTDYKSNVAPENNGNDPQHREEEEQNFDDLNRAFEDKISLQKEALNAEKYAKTKSKRKEMRDRRQDHSEERGAREATSPAQHTTMSMNYSIDSTSQFRGAAANAVNNGGGGASVFTTGTENPSLISYVTRSTMGPAKNQQDDVSLSLLESKSTVVPSDEDLIKIGWAKAYDPNTESYYYFTLDRSKTVWENPLNNV